MALLKHQIVVLPEHVNRFAVDKPVTAYQQRPGFAWYLCPATVGDDQEWLLINVALGYCTLVIAPETTALDIGEAAIGAIEYHLPDEREEDNVSVSLSGDDVAWHTAERMPEHVGLQYQQAQRLVAKCQTVHEADEALEGLNERPVTIGGRTFAPREGLEGVLLELADRYRDYIEHTPWWTLQWHLLIRKEAPWLD